MRVDLYTTVHKAQRFHLFRLSNEIGVSDFTNAVAAAHISGRARDMIAHLRDHARNEETYIHPLYREIGNVVTDIERGHQELESELNELERIVDEKRWGELYSRFAYFLGTYLPHLDEEEALQKRVLWPHYDDAALLAVFQRFKAERSAADSTADLEFMLPALSTAEITRMFAGMKA